MAKGERMRPSDRLKLIEIQGIDVDCFTVYSANSKDIQWLINRVKKLTEALEIVIERMEESPYKDMPRVTATSAQLRYLLGVGE